MKKILFYCQNLWGLGHLVRSTEIIRSLVKDFKVCLVDGGEIVQGFEIPPAVEVVQLPALWLENRQLKPVDTSLSLEEVKELRKNQLLAVYEQFQPDCLITECFPFSKRKLSFELIPLLDRVKSSGYSTKVVCSLRDVILSSNKTDLERKSQLEEKICALMNQYFDMLLFHSDPKVHRLEENFSKVKDLTCQIHYTGYVAQLPSENPVMTDEDIASLSRKEPMILVSIGGGRMGYELLESAVQAASILEQYLPHHIHIFTGPFLPQEQFSELQKLATDKNNITLRRYTPDLLAYMQKADLSISLGGYNTTMNVLRTGVRSMIFPSEKENEQVIRIQKLENLGIVEVIRPSDLEPAHLAQKIIAYLSKERVKGIFEFFDLQGAQKSSELLKEFLQTQVSAAYSTV
ncbi:glycosyl transferase [Scytonema sp. UIC 10036]|uniref:glycosyltransferase family protein n=1 Tax=Scytonema sp. UIC 10036 TaxID=2304196 RepID=UPI0012DA2319|nr:glycosyltransferase [Scytonema sp. UIC 10036]MUG92072.1 glycosyl transferase [Scytonema sp. UIC 10036]